MPYGTGLYRQEATVEPYLGSSAYGEQYGPPQSGIRCRFLSKRKVLRTARGDETVADAMLECRPDEPFTEKAKVTVSGDVFRVAQIHEKVGPTGVVNHLEVWLVED